MFNFDCNRLRKTVLDMAYAGSTVHIGCAFSIIEVLAVLHQRFLRYPENQPQHPMRDYLILSKGHGVMAQYACMRERGWLTDQDIAGYFSDGSHLKGLSDSRIAGLEVTSGSLGHGFSVGLGMALGAHRKKTDQKTYVIVGDGEINEGPIWEGALFASHHALKNFVVIVDENGFQAMGKTAEVLRLDSIADKFKAFGFEAVEADGHSMTELSVALTALLESTDSRPKALIARTVKGKGVSFMENDNRWHYSRLDAASYQRAIQEIAGSST
ncbi:transketolase [Variovorax sp. PCZ-1]|nr:transketolase [Variovorax sp. PCZ-1]